MFFARSASFFESANSLSASTVCEVRATACTLKGSRLPSSIGLLV